MYLNIIYSATDKDDHMEIEILKDKLIDFLCEEELHPIGLSVLGSEEKKYQLFVTNEYLHFLVALHESGHAVLSHHFGNKLEEIFINNYDPDNPHLFGWVKSTEDLGMNNEKPDIVTEEDVYKRLAEIRSAFLDEGKKKERVIFLLGGIAAENIHEDRPNNYVTAGAQTDLKNCMSILGSDIQQIIERHLPDAISILIEKWNAVLALSKILDDKERIIGEEAKRIIKENL